MKKISKISLITGIVLIMAMFLGSCGASNPLAGDDAVGTWEMTGAEYKDYTLTEKDLSTAMDKMPVFVINEDGTATFTFNGTDGSGTVTKGEDGKYTLKDGTDQSLNFTVEEGKLILDYTDMEMKMIFEQKSE